MRKEWVDAEIAVQDLRHWKSQVMAEFDRAEADLAKYQDQVGHELTRRRVIANLFTRAAGLPPVDF